MKLARVNDVRLKNVLKKISEQKLPIKTAMKLKKMINRFDECFKEYEELRVEALKKFSKKDENGNLIADNEGNADIIDTKGFIEEIQRIGSLNIEIDSISMEDVEDHLLLSVEDISILDDLLV